MKTGFISISWATLAFCCLAGQAQDTQAQDSGHVMGSVDFSVHARIEDRRPQPDPSRNAGKQPSALSSWSFQPTKQVPSAIAWPSHARPSMPDQGADRSSSGLRNRPEPFGVLAREGAHGSSKLPLVPTDPASPPSLPSEIQRFPSPFDRKQAELTGATFQNNFPRAKGIRAKRHKLQSPRFSGLSESGSSPSSAGGKH